MAEQALRAFGRYMRELRDRAGLSLLEVCRIADPSPEKINKGALSKLERGLQAPSLFKLATLCRIYHVSIEVPVERLELDREIEQQDIRLPDSATFAELLDRGRQALLQAERKWEAYACFRDALALDGGAQQWVAWVNLTTAIRSLGKNRLALHELTALRDSGLLSPASRSLVLDRIANCNRCLGEMERARRCADTAIEHAVELGDLRVLAFALNTRANVALDSGDPEDAVEYLNRGFRSYREGAGEASLLPDNPAFEVNSLLMLGDCHVQLQRPELALREAQAARKLAKRDGLPAGLAYSDLLVGRIEAVQGRADDAVQRWTAAAETARTVSNKRLEFCAEFELYRHHQQAGHRALARACVSRLNRLLPWVPPHLPACEEFREFRRKAAASPQGVDHEPA